MVHLVAGWFSPQLLHTWEWRHRGYVHPSLFHCAAVPEFVLSRPVLGIPAPVRARKAGISSKISRRASRITLRSIGGEQLESLAVRSSSADMLATAISTLGLRLRHFKSKRMKPEEGERTMNREDSLTKTQTNRTRGPHVTQMWPANRMPLLFTLLNAISLTTY